MRIAVKFDISGKGSQIESWKEQTIQRWKPGKNSIEKRPMAGIRAIAEMENHRDRFGFNVERSWSQKVQRQVGQSRPAEFRKSSLRSHLIGSFLTGCL
jgi:hypothetical protein